MMHVLQNANEQKQYFEKKMEQVKQIMFTLKEVEQAIKFNIDLE